MNDSDPAELADKRETEADELEQRSAELAGQVKDTREDWQRKREDPNVPGAPPPEETGEERESPAPEAPPESAGPSEAEMAPEGSAGPPADTLDDDKGQ